MNAWTQVTLLTSINLKKYTYFLRYCNENQTKRQKVQTISTHSK